MVEELKLNEGRSINPSIVLHDTNNVVRVMRAMMVGGGVSLRNTGSSPTAGGDIYGECKPRSPREVG